MPERPLLILPKPEAIQKPKGRPAFPPKINRPGADNQGVKFAPKFDRLKSAVGDPNEMAQLISDPASIAPERAIVFEVAGTIEDFYHKAKKAGLEYLGEDETLIEPNEEEFYFDGELDKEISGRIYLAMPDVQALNQLISLWERFTSQQKMPHGFTPWRELFDLLKDVRPWGPKDRIPDDTVAYWKELLAEHPNTPVRFEVELWFRENREKRAQAYNNLLQVINRVGGTAVHHAIIEDIRYDAALVDMPPGEIQTLIDNPNINIAIADDIMFIRPQSMASFKEELVELEDTVPQPTSTPQEIPIAALLDGVPVQNHTLLQNRIELEDPDGFESLTPVANRIHGTGMASLILHGDRNKQASPIRYRLYIRPVMYFHNHDERTTENQLIVDVIYRALMRIKEGEATAPDVFLVNLSLGDPNRPFTGLISPWARLIDYLSYQYKLLFIISAGNIKASLPVPPYQGSIDFENAAVEEREQNILFALNNNKSQRTLLSPSEAMNALTIGAWHSDSNTSPQSSTAIDPFPSGNLPNISSAFGLGYGKTIKPDLHFDGGKESVSLQPSGGSIKLKPLEIY